MPSIAMVALVSAAPTGCAPSMQVGDTTVAIVREAESLYDFGPERPPVEIRDDAFGGPLLDDSIVAPRMWISTATLKRGVSRPPQRILARIRSSGDFAPLGLHAGNNYVWRSSWDDSIAGRWQTTIVSGSRGAKAYTLRRDPRQIEYTHGDASEPRLVRITVHSYAIAVCLSDPVCTTGHCGYR